MFPNKFLKRWLLPPGIADVLAKAKRNLLGETGPSDIGRGPSPHDIPLLAKTALLKDRHRGQRCFILGAGPSVKRQDLRKLAGEVVISVSNTFVHPDFPIFRPRYHVLPHILRGHERLYPREKFVAWLREMERKTFDAEMVFHIGDRDLIVSNDLFRDRVVYWVEYSTDLNDLRPEIDPSWLPPIWSVSETALTLAVYMGFESIYLLGIDHDWFAGLFKYFFDEKTEHALRPDKTNLDYVDAEFQMRRHADIFRKYKYLFAMKKNIYNANADPNHYMDVFPKVNFESLFSSATATTMKP